VLLLLLPQGTKSSKKKKQAKLKRVMATLKKQARKEAALGSEGFAALHLLHDPQVGLARLLQQLLSADCTQFQVVLLRAASQYKSVFSQILGLFLC
jgi:hypothetical protein